MSRKSALRERSILIVSHICPYPTRSGVQVRIAQILDWLRREQFEVTYLLQPIAVESKQALAQLKENVQRLILVREHGLSKNLYRLIKAGLARVIRLGLPPLYERLRAKPQPNQDGVDSRYGDLEALCWPATVAVTRKALEALKPKFMLSEYGCFSPCLEVAPPGTVRMLDVLELYSINHEQQAATGIQEGFLCTAENERGALGKADVLIAIQRNDQKILTDWFPTKKIILMPSSYDSSTPIGAKTSPVGKGELVLYVGSPNYFNTHGLERFLRDSWPEVLQRCPSARLHVVGNLVPPEGVAMPGVKFLGRVSDKVLAEEYQRATVVINPQLAGTGLKIKCVEALSKGAALVTFPAGADGLEDGKNEAFLLATTAHEFVSHVATLLLDPSLRKRIQDGALQYAQRNFSEEAAFRGFGSLLKSP